MSTLAENLNLVQKRIAAACARVGRKPTEIQLLAVSKKFTPDIIREAADAGLTLFGENRIQEAKIKIPDCPGHLRWHFIGNLQTNKCRDAVAFFEMLHAVDSLHLAKEINKRCEQAAKAMPILIEVNVSGEGSKHGYSPANLLDELDELASLQHLEIHGLMTIAPWAAMQEKARPHFRRLSDIRKQCEENLGVSLPELSMGMSGDFEVAIEEGATIVRLGTALFGQRGKPTP